MLRKIARKGVVFAGLLLLSLVLPASLMAQAGTSVPTAEHDPQMATDWMRFVYELVRDETVNAPAASRVYAYTAIALYEAVVPGMPNNYSVSGQLEDLPMLPYPQDGQVYDWPSVANASISTVVRGLFADSPADAAARIDTMREQQTAARSQSVASDVVERSLALGDEIGAALVDWMNTDGYAAIHTMVYSRPTGDPSLWVPTTEGQEALEPFWGQLRPFGMAYGEGCNVPMRMPFSTDPSSTFYHQAAEVLETSDMLTDEQRAIARFWIDTPGVTGAPSGHWVMIETQVIEQTGLKLDRAAEMYMLTNMALADAFISAWNMKYQINLVRPVTFIQKFIRRNWTPYVQTPPFPEYPSGHSVASGAAAEVLTTMFGEVAFTDRTPIINGHENLERSFTSFEAAASEAAISRLYGGIHYRAAIELGLRQGRCVGQAVLNNIRLRPIPQGGGG